mgnify:CR=1 FL=1
MSIKESTSKKNYSNKTDNNIKVATAPKLRLGVYQNPSGDRTKKSIDAYVKGMREKKYNPSKKSLRIKTIR